MACASSPLAGSCLQNAGMPPDSSPHEACIQKEIFSALHPASLIPPAWKTNSYRLYQKNRIDCTENFDKFSKPYNSIQKIPGPLTPSLRSITCEPFLPCHLSVFSISRDLKLCGITSPRRASTLEANSSKTSCLSVKV